MYDSFDAFEYVEYLGKRWRVVAAAAGVAVALSVAITLLIPKRYTATASVLIETPGANDVRVATAVSAVYLDSLKTYESFAASDSLFAQAAQKFHLQENGAEPSSLESLKRQVLKVSIPRNTKVLEISATLSQPPAAQAVAQYLAEHTVEASRAGSMAADSGLAEEAQKQVSEAHTRLDDRQQAWTSLAATAPVVGLQDSIDAAIDLQGKLREQLVESQANVAEYQPQTQAGGQFAKEQLAAAQARAALLDTRLGELNREIQVKSSELANRSAKREAAESELKTAQTGYEAALARLRDIRATAGTHREQLHVIDPGIVPQAPSSPNLPFNVTAALLLAVVSSIVYLSGAFLYRRRAGAFQPALSRGMRE